jgi:hypothetical protein
MIMSAFGFISPTSKSKSYARVGTTFEKYYSREQFC